MEGGRLPNAALHGHVEGERSRGRQRKTWMDNIQERDTDLTKIGDIVRNREDWRGFIRASSSGWTDEKKEDST